MRAGYITRQSPTESIVVSPLVLAQKRLYYHNHRAPNERACYGYYVDASQYEPFSGTYVMGHRDHHEAESRVAWELAAAISRKVRPQYPTTGRTGANGQPHWRPAVS